MPYSEVAKKATMKYMKDKQQELKIRYKKDDYEQRIQPAIKKTGKPVSTFIKEAVEEKMEREHLLDE